MADGHCSGCGKTRSDLRVACPHCGAKREITGPVPPITAAQAEALEAMRKKRAPSPAESTARFASVVSESPVFADLDVMQPLGTDLKIEMEPKFELSSAPADAEPVVNLLFTLLPEGPPLLDPAAGPTAHVILALDLSK